MLSAYGTSPFAVNTLRQPATQPHFGIGRQSPGFTIQPGAERTWQAVKTYCSTHDADLDLTYAVRWAQRMEQAMKSGDTLEQAAQKTQEEAKPHSWMNTPFARTMAVAILSQVWVQPYGQALRDWHN